MSTAVTLLSLGAWQTPPRLENRATGVGPPVALGLISARPPSSGAVSLSGAPANSPGGNRKVESNQGRNR